MMQTKQRVEREFSELKTDKEKMVTEITQLKTDKVSMYREIAKLKIDKDKIKEQFDQTQAILLNDLKIKSLRKTNEKLLKVKSEVSRLSYVLLNILLCLYMLELKLRVNCKSNLTIPCIHNQILRKKIIILHFT